jgi:alkylation response protein AidB-like acyl-CoA dehydrogenase
MERVLTPRQQEIVDLAGRLADTFAERAERWDRENAFPFENYEDLRREGYLTLTVPTDLGGMGADLWELCLAQERLAMGDGSTALAVNMHVSPIAQWAHVWRQTGDPRLESMLRGVVAGEIVWASLTSEPGYGGGIWDCATRAERTDGGYRVTGRKIFCTNSEVATHFSFTARYEDPERGPRVLLFRAAKDAPGVEFLRTWDVMGMRGTQSNDMKLEEVFVPEDALVHSLPVDHFDSRILQTVFAFAMATFGATYLGVAAGAMEWTRRSVVERGRARDPYVQWAFAEMELLLESARALLERHAREVVEGEIYRRLSVQQGLARTGVAKVVAVNNAVEIMRWVQQVLGGVSYHRRFPIERMWRDVQGGPIMPWNNVQAHKLFGATALGVQLAPEIGPDETGLDSRAKEPVDEPFPF